jgi:hypothetical protein
MSDALVLTIPVSETLSLMRFDSNTKEFVKKVTDRHHTGELGYELDLLSEPKLLIKDANEICRGKVFPLGVYGFYKKPNEADQLDNSEKQEEISDNTDKDKNVYHWSWIWGLPENHEYRSRFNNAGVQKINDLRDQMKKDQDQHDLLSITLCNIFNNANIFSDDSMINSYIESVLLEQLSLDTVYNILIDEHNNIYLALGVTDVVWYDPIKIPDIIPINYDDE